MKNEKPESMPVGQSEEEVAQWFLTHDTSEDIDVSKIEMPNLHKVGRSVRGDILEADLEELQILAESSKKTPAELIGIFVHRGLNELRANPSIHL